jgi:hypothetical protein
MSSDLMHQDKPAAPMATRSDERATPPAPRRNGRPAAAILAPLFDTLFPTGVPVRFAFWDGSALGRENDTGTVVVRWATPFDVFSGLQANSGWPAPTSRVNWSWTEISSRSCGRSTWRHRPTCGWEVSLPSGCCDPRLS